MVLIYFYTNHGKKFDLCADTGVQKRLKEDCQNANFDATYKYETSRILKM